MASFKLGMALFGFDEMANKFDALKDGVKAAAREAAIEVAHMIMDNAKNRTPVETGLLQSTGYVGKVRSYGGGKKVTIEFGFGPGGAEDYAEIQHENEDYHHTIGEVYFLAKAIEEYENKSKAVLNRIIMRELRHIASRGK